MSRQTARSYRLFVVASVVVSVCSMTVSALAQSSPDGITIGIIGDQTFSTDIQASYVVLGQGVSELSHQNVGVVLHVGDLIESSKSPDEVRALFQQATGILDRLPVNWFMVAGDHDVNPPLFQQ